MNIQYIIMAHTERREFIPYLKERLGDVPVSMDDGNWGLVQAHVKAWERYDPEADYTFVIQDDVKLTSDFLQKADHHVRQGTILYGKDLAFHFYLRNSPRFNGRIKQWKEDDSDHILLANLHSGNSVGLPTRLIPNMLEYFKTMEVASGDERINSFIHSQGMKVYFPMPNLCQHRNVPSLHDRNSSPVETRVSVWWEP